MLDVTILKVHHATEKEAKKLRPYIEQCDVFSPENGFGVEEDVRKYEDNWCETLKKGTRSLIKNIVESTSASEDPLTTAYKRKLFDQLYLSKRLLWYLEQHTRENYRLWSQLDAAISYKYGEAFDNLEHGNISSFVKCLWARCRLSEDLLTIRDENMAQNLMKAEDNIRQKYPHLQQEPLKYSVMIGACHAVERYASTPLNCIDLSQPSLEIADLFGELIPSRTSFDESRPLLLAFGVRYLASSKKIRIPDQQILAMDEPTLEKTLREMIE